MIGIAAGSRDPQAMAGLHHGVERGHKPAGTALADNLPFLKNVLVRLAVGYDDKKIITQLFPDKSLQVFFCPHDDLPHSRMFGLFMGYVDGAGRIRNRNTFYFWVASAPPGDSSHETSVRGSRSQATNQ
jgi:hypothetical protein